MLDIFSPDDSLLFTTSLIGEISIFKFNGTNYKLFQTINLTIGTQINSLSIKKDNTVFVVTSSSSSTIWIYKRNESNLFEEIQQISTTIQVFVLAIHENEIMYIYDGQFYQYEWNNSTYELKSVTFISENNIALGSFSSDFSTLYGYNSVGLIVVEKDENEEYQEVYFRNSSSPSSIKISAEKNYFLAAYFTDKVVCIDFKCS